MHVYGVLMSGLGVVLLIWAATEARELGAASQISWSICGAAALLSGAVVGGLAVVADRIRERNRDDA